MKDTRSPKSTSVFFRTILTYFTKWSIITTAFKTKPYEIKRLTRDVSLLQMHWQSNDLVLRRPSSRKEKTFWSILELVEVPDLRKHWKKGCFLWDRTEKLSSCSRVNINLVWSRWSKEHTFDNDDYQKVVIELTRNKVSKSLRKRTQAIKRRDCKTTTVVKGKGLRGKN